MTSYNSQTGDGKFNIQFETDNKDHYERVQRVIRECIDEEEGKKRRPLRLFVSQPMRGKTDEEIRATRNEAIAAAEKVLGRKVEVLDSFFQGTDMSPLECLGESLKLLAQADVAYFASGWQLARGCVIERECAERYGIKAIVI